LVNVKIKLTLHTTLQRKYRFGLAGQGEVDVPAGSTLAVLFNQLHMDLDMEQILLVVNGRTSDLSHQLLEGDHVHVIPAISGG